MTDLAPSDPLSILVVDDEPDMEMMMRQMFRSRVRRGQYALSFAGDGVEALERIDAGPPVDLIITDINMPRMTGLELLAALRDRGCDAKSIVVSAYGDMANIRGAMNCGAFDFITKPVDFDDLEATVDRTRRCLATWRAALAKADDARRLAREGALARAVQRAIVPEPPGWDTRFRVRAGLSSGAEFCGDFADVVRLEDERVGLVAARAPASGAACAMAMVNARGVFKGAAIGERAPDAVLARASEMLGAHALDGDCCDALYAVYDPLERTVECAGAGAASVFTVSAAGACAPLAPVQSAGRPYRLGRAVLGPRDGLIACSRAAHPTLDLAPHLFGGVGPVHALAEALAPTGTDLACVLLDAGP